MIHQIIANGLIAGAGYALVAVGFSLLFATNRFYSFAYGAIFAVAPYATLAIRESTGCGLVMAGVGGCFIALACGGGLELAVFKPLRRRGSPALVLMIASLGGYVVLQNCLSMLFGDATRSLRSPEVQVGREILGARVTEAQLWLGGVSLLLLIGTWGLLTRTKLGRSIKAIACEPFVAECVGINTGGVLLLTTALACLLAGTAGVLVGLDTDLTPRMGFSALLMGMVASVVGGLGSALGAVIGALSLGLVMHLGIWMVGSQWQEAIAFGTMAFFLVLRPQGILGTKLRSAGV